MHHLTINIFRTKNVIQNKLVKTNEKLDRRTLNPGFPSSKSSMEHFTGCHLLPVSEAFVNVCRILTTLSKTLLLLFIYLILAF